MTSPVLVVGSVALDTVETREGRREDILGGAATFIALAASRFGPVNLVAVIGANDFPVEHTELLTSQGVNLDGLERAHGRTFRWSGVYADDFSSRRTLDTQLGVFESFDPKIPASYLANRYVMLGNIHPGLQLKVLNALSDDAFVVADTMNLWIETTRGELDEVIDRVDLLIINDEEATLLTGERQMIAAARRIQSNGPRKLVIKRGEHGAYLFDEDTIFLAPALPLAQVVDPTGAGDTFAGGLIGYLASRNDASTSAIKKGMLYGAALASMAVGDFGAQHLATVSRSELDAKWNRLLGLVALD